MNVKLYSCSDVNNKIVKNILLKKTVTGYIKDECNIETPTINIEANDFTITDCNYCRIDEFGRYYFIKNISFDYTGLCVIELAIDVLMTFSTSILNLTAHVERNEDIYNNYLTDNNLASYNFPMVLTKKFERGFDELKYYLVVSSGGDTSE